MKGSSLCDDYCKVGLFKTHRHDPREGRDAKRSELRGTFEHAFALKSLKLLLHGIGYKISKSLWFSNCEEKARVEWVEAGLFADGTFWKLTLESGVQGSPKDGVQGSLQCLSEHSCSITAENQIALLSFSSAANCEMYISIYWLLQWYCAALSHLLMYNTPSLGDVLCHVAFWL